MLSKEREMKTSKKLERLLNRLSISRSVDGREILKEIIVLENKLGIVEREGERERETQIKGTPLRMRARGK